MSQDIKFDRVAEHSIKYLFDDRLYTPSQMEIRVFLLGGLAYVLKHSQYKLSKLKKNSKDLKKKFPLENGKLYRVCNIPYVT